MSRRSSRATLRDCPGIPQMKHIGKALALAMTMAKFTANAEAQDDVARAWAAGCLSCHQPSTRALPALAGQSRDVLIEKLRAFRDGAKTGTVMPQIAKGYTDAQIDAIARWFSGQPAVRP